MIINTEYIDAINEDRKPVKIPDFRIKYIATDGWRGYNVAKPSKKSKWIPIDSDWVTGNWEDAGDNSSDNIEEKLRKLGDRIEAMGGEFIVIFLPTSNVFSTAYDSFVRGLNANQIKSLQSNT